MNIFVLILILAGIGLLTWAVLTYVPMPRPFQTLLVAVVCIVTALWVLSVFGLLGSMNSVRVG